jgi:hypothetical protein
MAEGGGKFKGGIGLGFNRKEHKDRKETRRRVGTVLTGANRGNGEGDRKYEV